MTGLESDQVQGNFGIMDQKLALKWVHENIDAFGGDKDKVGAIKALSFFNNSFLFHE